MENLIEGRRRSGAHLWLADGGGLWLLQFLFFLPSSILSLLPPCTQSHPLPWTALLLEPLTNRQFCPFRSKAFCGFFNIKVGERGGGEEGIGCRGAATRGDYWIEMDVISEEIEEVRSESTPWTHHKMVEAIRSSLTPPITKGVI